jgi:hypothetical protein
MTIMAVSLPKELRIRLPPDGFGDDRHHDHELDDLPPASSTRSVPPRGRLTSAV